MKKTPGFGIRGKCAAAKIDGYLIITSCHACGRRHAGKTTVAVIDGQQITAS
jgi:hypothetical protein